LTGAEVRQNIIAVVMPAPGTRNSAFADWWQDRVRMGWFPPLNPRLPGIPSLHRPGGSAGRREEGAVEIPPTISNAKKSAKLLKEKVLMESEEFFIFSGGTG
jgi:hypothetical protein